MIHVQDKKTMLNQGILIFIYLGALSLIEYFIAVAFDAVPLLVLVLLIKAVLVAYYYMHIYKLSLESHVEDEGSYEYKTGTNRLGLWLFLISDSFVFAGLMVTRMNLLGLTRPHLDQALGLFITMILLVSSFFMNRAEVIIGKGVYKVLFGLVFSPLMGVILGFIIMLQLSWVFRSSAPSSVSKLFGRLQIMSSAYMAFSHGSNDSQKAMGIITMGLVSDYNLPDFHVPFWVVVLCAVAMALGTAAGGWRIIKTLGVRLVHLRPIHGFAAERPAEPYPCPWRPIWAPRSRPRIPSPGRSSASGRRGGCRRCAGKRVLTTDAVAVEYITLDKKRVVVDHVSRWKIEGPLEFYRSVRTEAGALARLEDILVARLRQEIGTHTFIGFIREEREKIVETVAKEAHELAKRFGIRIIDVRIKRADLPKDVQASVYARMQAERHRIAKRYRAEGEERSREIKAQTDKEKEIILAKAVSTDETFRRRGWPCHRYLRLFLYLSRSF